MAQVGNFYSVLAHGDTSTIYTASSRTTSTLHSDGGVDGDIDDGADDVADDAMMRGASCAAAAAVIIDCRERS